MDEQKESYKIGNIFWFWHFIKGCQLGFWLNLKFENGVYKDLNSGHE